MPTSRSNSLKLEKKSTQNAKLEEKKKFNYILIAEINMCRVEKKKSPDQPVKTSRQSGKEEV